ncbi:MAG: LLM class flavin-dependent oxidoreductase [Bacteroidota bacterium]
MLKLGVLSFDVPNALDIGGLVSYAVKADELGYSKFWLGEHYDSPGLWLNPEPLIPILLGFTEQISIGAAGIILRVHSSYRVAANFRLMNALFPGRVDLGLASGHAPALATKALTNMEKAEVSQIDVKEKIAELLAFYREEEANMKQGLFVNPPQFSPPNIWLLGARLRSFEYATRLGINQSFSLMHNPDAFDVTKVKLEEMTETFFQEHGKRPDINVAFSGVLAKDEKEARKIYGKSLMNNPFIKPNILGGFNMFQDQLLQFQEEFGVNEFVFLDLSPEMSHRLETIEQLASLLKPELVS